MAGDRLAGYLQGAVVGDGTADKLRRRDLLRLLLRVRSEGDGRLTLLQKVNVAPLQLPLLTQIFREFVYDQRGRQSMPLARFTGPLWLFECVLKLEMVSLYQHVLPGKCDTRNLKLLSSFFHLLNLRI